MTNRELSQVIRKDLKEHGITSKDVLAHKIYNESHIVYSDLAGAIEEETLKEFFNLILDYIVVVDRRIVEIVFSNGLSHQFIYRK